DTTAIPSQLISSAPVEGWSSESLAKVRNGLGPAARARWVWLNPPQPKSRLSTLARIIEDEPSGVVWHTPQQTQRLLGMMTGRNREKVEAALRMKTRQVGAVYKRMRVEKDGARRQRAEARFDGLAGCLRTPAGGSSRQIILIVENGQARSRLISPRETARLMGLPEDYQLPTRPNKAYHLTGDGVATPVVRWLAETILEPALMGGAEKLAPAQAMAPGAMD
ncbi:MAG: DNA cytosine methyltransferase, partial [Nitrospinota bacterium]|nr:DNA cytosine methyltransferase [Nitrospinota bacterium]